MAYSPELEEVEEALVEARKYMVREYSDFLEKTNLSQKAVSKLVTLHRQTGDCPPVGYDTDIGRILYKTSIHYLGSQSGAHVGIKFDRMEDFAQIQDRNPTYMGVVIDGRDFSNPIHISFGWTPKQAIITNFQMMAEGAMVLSIWQQTRRDLLFRGPKGEEEEQLTPIQFIRTNFFWRENSLAYWTALLTIPGHEDDIQEVLFSNAGEPVVDGDRANDYELPEGMFMPLAIRNMIGNLPARLGAFY